MKTHLFSHYSNCIIAFAIIFIITAPLSLLLSFHINKNKQSFHCVWLLLLCGCMKLNSDIMFGLTQENVH